MIVQKAILKTSRITKSNSNKYTLVVFLVVLNVVFTGCSLGTQSVSSYTSVTDDMSSDDYTHDKIIPIEDLSVFEQETVSLLYFGRPTCIECVSIESVFFEALETSATSIFYFNTDYWRERDGFDDVLQSFNVESVPLFVQVQNGEFVKSLSGAEVLNVGDEPEQVALLQSFFNFT